VPPVGAVVGPDLAAAPARLTGGKVLPPNTSRTSRSARPGSCTVAERGVAARFATHSTVSVSSRRRNASTASLSQASGTYSPTPNTGWARRTSSIPRTQCSSEVGIASCASTFRWL